MSFHAGISASVGLKAFQVTPVPEGLQSMSALPVCALMVHLEYNCHSCLDKTLLICGLPLFSLLLTLSFCLLFCIKIFSPSFLYLSVVCPIDLFVSAVLMVPSFGRFVNTLDIIAILWEGGERKGGIRMSSGLPNCFDEAIAKSFLCVSNRLVALGAFSYLLKVGISEKLI